MVEDPLYGPLISTEDVVEAAVTTLRLWMREYIASVERSHQLQRGTIPRPPTPESYHGGNDFDSWIAEDAPEIMVVAKPSGEPELSASAGYTQGYELQVGCLCIGKGSELAERAEDDARIVCSHLGAASMLLVQQPTLGGLTERLRMTGAPDITFPDPERRAVQQVVTTFEVWVSSIIREDAGPVGPTPKESPGFEGIEEPFQEAPTVETVDITVNA